MKKTIILIALITLLLQLTDLYAQDKKKGDFKKCTVYSYTYKFGKLDLKSKKIVGLAIYDRNGNITDTVAYIQLGKKNKTTYKYDSKGNEIESVYYNANGDVRIIWYRTYNENGKEVESKCYDDDGVCNSKSTYKYDISGLQMIEQLDYIRLIRMDIRTGNCTYGDSKNTRTTYQYDAANNKTEEVTYKEDGTLISKINYQYDAANNITEEFTYKEDGSLEYKNTYKYDSEGDKIEELFIRADGSIITKTTYRYAKYDNCIDEMSYDTDGSYSGKITYKYDKDGNIIEEVQYDSDNRIWDSDKYNVYGNIIEHVAYDWETHEPEWKNEYIYTK